MDDQVPSVSAVGPRSVERIQRYSVELWPNLLWRNHSAHECIPIQAQIPEKVDLLEFQMIFSILYLFVWSCALLGNLSVIYVVSLKQVKMSSVRSVFICSLAISDVLMSLTSVPTAVSIFTRDWGGSVFVSSFTLTAIAVDRYILIRKPASETISFKRAILIVMLMWTVGYSFALPVGIFSSVEVYPPWCGHFCDEFWPDGNEFGVSRLRKTYGMLVSLFNLECPQLSHLCAIGELAGKNRSNRMMLTMVVGLVLAWLPMNLINLWRDFDNIEEKTSEWYSLVFALCHATGMTSAVWNPVIYSWFNPQFKETLRSSLKRRKSQAAIRCDSIHRTSTRKRLTPRPVPSICLRRQLIW
uniref:G-protein coupled receptors family 1 profile domain-containing protein n=1 Tax=Ditylenchus dipsaci TaxID=166011 RepID=A0A915CY94_9BILA